jgi:hypothetical protein
VKKIVRIRIGEKPFFSSRYFGSAAYVDLLETLKE